MLRYVLDGSGLVRRRRAGGRVIAAAEVRVINVTSAVKEESPLNSSILGRRRIVTICFHSSIPKAVVTALFVSEQQAKDIGVPLRVSKRSCQRGSIRQRD